jgi:predicted kinase
LAEVRPANGSVHLICGATGAGKSTYSGNLAVEIGGVRLSIDEWLHRLHFVDQPPTLSFDWFYERVQRDTAQMRDIANQLLPLSVPCIFDCGFTNLVERQIFYDWAKKAGFPVCLHWIDVSPQIRWQRVQKRNADKGETFMFEVNRAMFQFIEGIWEAPTQAEIDEHNGKRIAL